MDRNVLDRLVCQGGLSHFDLHFAKKMDELSGGVASENILILFALASSSVVNSRHICLDLNALCNMKNLSECFVDLSEKDEKIFMAHELPDDPGKLVRELLETKVVARAGRQDLSPTPLVIDDRNRLYIYRYWDYERKLGQMILAKASAPRRNLDFRLAAGFVSEYLEFQRQKNKGFSLDEWQKVAVFAALRNNLTVISGGPGTGKTTIAAAILSVLIKSGTATGNPPKISVCAPTGKAGARMREALADNMDAAAKSLFKPEASTIHRLLGYIPDSPYFRANAENKLPSDVLLIDEASMIPVSMMKKLMQAVRDDAKVIFLGDKDQLASVESGAVLRDLCEASDMNRFTKDFIDGFGKFSGSEFLDSKTSNKAVPLSDSAVQLMKSHRFNDSKGIGKVSRAVNSQDKSGTDEAVAELAEGKSDEISAMMPMPRPAGIRGQLIRILEMENDFSDYPKAENIADAYEKFSSFKIVCAIRKGKYGVDNINRLVEEMVKTRHGIRTENYRGKPLMITVNDYSLKLFNGDVGLLWDDGEGGELRAFFPNPDHVVTEDTENERFISYPISRLPEHESVFAMTVHKAQGSGFRHVLFILPDRSSPVLTKELVYTAITRAQKKVYVWADEKIFREAVEKRTVRSSGLRDMLNIEQRTFNVQHRSEK